MISYIHKNIINVSMFVVHEKHPIFISDTCTYNVYLNICTWTVFVFRCGQKNPNLRSSVRGPHKEVAQICQWQGWWQKTQSRKKWDNIPFSSMLRMALLLSYFFIILLCLSLLSLLCDTFSGWVCKGNTCLDGKMLLSNSEKSS